jgi:hypothetical protein
VIVVQSAPIIRLIGHEDALPEAASIHARRGIVTPALAYGVSSDSFRSGRPPSMNRQGWASGFAVLS